tara:strand:+ start:1887 stop:2189 length:303 start_codon:yes stop_codon:yes gene_type:complete
MLRNVQCGRFYRVKNKDKKASANDHYNMIVVEDLGGDIQELLFTDSDLVKGVVRAKKNREDIPPYRIKVVDGGFSYWLGLILTATSSGVAAYYIRDLGLF